MTRARPVRQGDPAAVPGAPARLGQHLSLARGKHLPRCPLSATGSLQPIPAPFGCLCGWDIKPVALEREDLPEGSPKAPSRLPRGLGQPPPHLPLPSLQLLATTVPWACRAGREATEHGAAGTGCHPPGAGGGHRPRWASSRPGYPCSPVHMAVCMCVRSYVRV